MGTYKTSSFWPHKKGLSRLLGELEHHIMAILWRRGEATVKEVLQELLERRDLAPSTVFTVMGRLVGKGLLARTKEDHVFVYRPLLSEAALRSQAAHEVLSGLLESCGDYTVASLVDVLAMQDPEKLEGLAKLIEERRRRR